MNQPHFDIGAVEATSYVKAKVSSVVVNDGAVQCSRLHNIKVNFDRLLYVDSILNFGDIRLTRTQVVPNSGAILGTEVITGELGHNGQIIPSVTGVWTNTLTLTFANGDDSNITQGVEYGSLADGRWQLSIPYLNEYLSPLNGNQIYRLFGDANGDRTVDGNDLLPYGSFFNGPSIAFDFDQNNTVDTGDYDQFQNRFGKSL